MTKLGSDGKYMWSVPAGSLPIGLDLNTSTSEISGAPSGSGRPFAVQVASGGGYHAQQTLSINVSGALVLQRSDLCAGHAVSAVSAVITRPVKSIQSSEEATRSPR